jgi:hypothetical protein
MAKKIETAVTKAGSLLNIHGWIAPSAIMFAVSLVLFPVGAQSQNVTNLDEITDESVLDAFKTLESYFAGAMAVIDITLVDSTGEPKQEITINPANAKAASFPTEFVSQHKIDKVESETTVTTSGSPGCVLKQVGGTYYWVPSPPCP